MLLNRYPWWKNLLIILVVLGGVIYALPNIFGEDPALQISATRSTTITPETVTTVTQALDQASIPYKSIATDKYGITVRFNSAKAQADGITVVNQSLGDNYIVALN